VKTEFHRPIARWGSHWSCQGCHWGGQNRQRQPCAIVCHPQWRGRKNHRWF